MERRRLGETDLEVTRIALGGFPFAAANRAEGWDPYAPEGRRAAIATIHAALEAGVGLIDTGPMYGEGHSETLIGEALRGRGDRPLLATKVAWRGATRDGVVASVEGSLRRLGADHVDLLQLHGDYFEAEDAAEALGPAFEAMEALRERGLARWLGVTGEEAAMLRPFLRSGRVHALQTAYNFIQQGAASHLLPEAAARGVGVIAMRPLTSGAMQRMTAALAPELAGAGDLSALCLKFVLADSRIACANVGMRSPEEVARNVAIAESFRPPLDVAVSPRTIGALYAALDAEGSAR